MDDFMPDHAEQEFGDQTDNAVPSRGYQTLPVVGLGGSAGGVEALRAFFEHMPADSGMAFVVIMHLARDHESTLAEVLQRSTAMPVHRVREAGAIEVNTVYVIPPGKMLHTGAGKLELSDLPRDRSQHVAVDFFFRTLAETHGPRAVAVVLSGQNGDGAIGIKRVKERGGLAIAQDPQEAQHAGMPQSAIATGLVDWVLPAGEIGPRIVDYRRLEGRLRLPPEQPRETSAANDGDSAARDEAALQDVLGFVRARTGRNFANYKRATMLRRIGRRMQVNNVSDLVAYLACLRTRPGEVGALLQDMLISVTNFFRDGDCFAAIERSLPELFRGKGPGDAVRVWVAACATGEEAYTLAILLSEYAGTLDAPPAIQVFASDIDEEAIRAAREGVYPSEIEGDLSPERLRRFFMRETRGYRVRRELRELILFAVHDVLSDSPFSRINLVSCRNLLIYLNRGAQTRVLQTLHFSLARGGQLFLGASESVESEGVLFDVVDKKRRLYIKRETVRAPLPVPAGPSNPALVLDSHRTTPVVASAALGHLPSAGQVAGQNDRRPGSWGELHLELLDRLAPPSLIVTREFEVLHASRAAGRFLHFAGGEPTRNVLRLIDRALRIELQAALYHVSEHGSAVEVPAVALVLNGEPLEVAVEVRPVEDASGLLLVLLHAGPRAAAPAGTPSIERIDPEPLVQHLEREIDKLKQLLRETVEQYETSTEELKASNEELQAMNEELHSAAEELETSREELQSINEEVTTVNHELNSNVNELAHANSDMHNLMDATAIATIFLDRELRITRFTPSAVTIFKLIASDVGRPLSDLTSTLSYSQLSEDAQLVLERLISLEREVGEAGGRWYLVRARPYRTLDDRIAGVVLTFVDITERKLAQENLRQSEERFSAIVNQASVGVAQALLDGALTFANSCFCTLLGHEASELMGVRMVELVHPAERQATERLFERLAKLGRPFHAETRCLRKNGAPIWLHLSVSVLTDAKGEPDSALIVCNDITERKDAEEALRESTERLRLVVENAVDYAIFSTDLDRRVRTWNAGAQRLLGYTEAEILGQSGDVIFTPEDREAGAPQAEATTALATGRAADDRLHQRKDGSRFWASGALMTMHDSEGKVIGLVKILRDQSEQRRTQEALEQSKAELTEALQAAEAARGALQDADAAKDQFLAVLSHELRNPLASVVAAAEVLESAPAAEHDRARAVEIVQRQTHTMKVLLEDLLDIASLRRGQLVLRRRKVDAAYVVEGALEAVRPMVAAARHRLTTSLPERAVPLDADPVRLSQVLANLVANSCKYTPEGGHIDLSVRTTETDVVFEVSDNGIGMDPETINHMFEMFARTPQEGGHGPAGLGIGLALVRSILALHGGSVTGTSEGLGRGSRFVVTVPLDRTPADAVEPEPAEPPAAAEQLPGGRRVLLADDNADAVWALSQMLRLVGHEVRTAGDGEEALRVAQEFEPAVAVLDLGMPLLDGYEVARRIRAAPWGAQMRLIAATGWGQEEDRKRALDAGFDVHMVKPVDLDKLQNLIIEASPKL